MKKSFHLGDILSVTHDRLVSPRLIDGVFDICNWLTQDGLFTHQLVRVHDECKAALLAQHPDLNNIPPVSDEAAKACTELNGKGWWRIWLDARIAEYGEYRDVEPMPKGIHEYKDPITEAVEMVGKDRVIVITEGKP